MNTKLISSKNADAWLGALWLAFIFASLNFYFNTIETFVPTMMNSPIVIQWDFFRYILPVMALSVSVAVLVTRNTGIALIFGFVLLTITCIIFFVLQDFVSTFPPSSSLHLLTILIPSLAIFVFGIATDEWEETAFYATILLVSVLKPTIFLVLGWLAVLAIVLFVGFEKLKPEYAQS